MRARKAILAISSATAAALLAAGSASAYHFFQNDAFEPHRWQSLPVSFLVDAGPTDIQAEIGDAVSEWNDVPTAVELLSAEPATDASGDPLDFTADNFETAWGLLTGDGQQEVVFDEDGSIIRDVLGRDPATLNGIGPSRRVTVSGTAILDDAFLVINGSRANFDRRSTEVHEFGHTLGLAHSSVGMFNSAAFPADALDVIAIADVPTMHPTSAGTGTARRTLAPDDRAGISELYPDAGFGALGVIEGIVTACGTDRALTGVNVRAVNTADPSVQVSRYTGFDGNEDGIYRIAGLPPGQYRVVVEPFGNSLFTAGRMALRTRIDRGFASEYHSEIECPEDLPDTPRPVAAGGATAEADVEVGGVRFALVVDDTGSMSEEIAGVRETLRDFIDLVEGLPLVDFPPTALITFKDDVTVRAVTDDPNELRALVEGLTATGGGDCPESSLAALLAAGRMLDELGVALFFTDADSRPDGPTLGEVVRLYLSRGALAVPILNGTCTAGAGAALSPNPEGQARVSDLPGSAESVIRCAWAPSLGAATADEFPPPETLGPQSSVVTFSSLAEATGGFFAFFDEVGEAYINTASNIAAASVVPSVGLVTPMMAPRGTTLDIAIHGGNTNFSEAGSDLRIDGLTIESVDVVSPTRIEARIRIPTAAALGFYDVEVETDLGSGVVERATGTGAFEVEDASAGPLLLSIVPATALAGSSLEVAVSTGGLDLEGSTPDLDLGPGVTVESMSVVDEGRFLADLSLAPDAAPGFREATVNAGGTTVSADRLFLVVEAIGGIPRITDVSPDSGSPGETLTMTISGLDTSFTPGVTSVEFSGSGLTTGDVSVLSSSLLSVEVDVGADAQPGFRDVRVTTLDEVAVSLDAFEVQGLAEPGLLEIPTLSTLGLLVLVGGLALLAVWRLSVLAG